MQAELYRFSAPPRPCSYLPAETACMEYRIFLLLANADYDELLRRGWRRMGCDFFRPRCAACTRCRSLRVSVGEFQPSKSQRRILKANADLRLVVQRPSVTDDHLRLWHSYHSYMAQTRGWAESRITAREYEESFLPGLFAFPREYLYFLGNRLVAVGLVDETETSFSSVYFYHDPELRRRALGVYSVLCELTRARAKAIPHAYLGYWISECQSMAYKSQYRPHEILSGLPEDEESPIWTRAAR